MDLKKNVGLAAVNKTHLSFDAFISELKASGLKFPCNQYGKPNLKYIANRVGCSRDTLRHGSLSKPLKSAIVEIGCQTKLCHRTTKSKPESPSLKIELLHKEREIQGLKIQIEKLRYETEHLYSNRSEEESRFIQMLIDGTRFTL
jgi:hypothetical protein